MPNFKQITFVSLVMLTALMAVACTTISQPTTPTPENTPSPTVAPTLENTPLPQVLSTTPPTMKGHIDVNGYKLAYQCFGEGSPTVIVEAALFDQPTVAMTWKQVTERVQTVTRICIYNRAEVRTSQDIAQNLHMLLSRIPLPGPYILVGHSIGGYHVRVFAHLYPQEVAGMVLVDTTYPDPMKEFLKAYPTYTPNELPALTSDRATMVAPTPTVNVIAGDFDVAASTEQVIQAGSLGDLPLIVISQHPDPTPWMSPGFSSEDAERLSTAWQNLQADLATLSSKGVFMTAKYSGHYIPVEEPQIIIDALTQMVKEIRSQ
ncbi:MAG: alpha/beta hydrolase [Anaerolineales bacterium]|nr:alpha/beta hydrolase [Anaerolineales bacterium]